MAAKNSSPKAAESLSVAPIMFLVWQFGGPGDTAELGSESSQISPAIKATGTNNEASHS